MAEKATMSKGDHDDDRREIGTTSIKSATLNMITQVTFRIITFILNAYVLRHINRDVMGLINVRLNLLDDTILFLSREGFRLACLSHTGKEWQSTLNLMWLCVPVSVVWSLLLSWAWIHLLPSPDDQLMPQYERAVVIVALSGVVQMFAEVPGLLAQVFLYVRLRIAMDFLWMLTRVLVLVLAVMFTPDRVVVVWAYGHFLAGCLYVLGFFAAFGLAIKYGGSSRSCSHGPTIPFSSLRQLLPALNHQGQFHIHPEYRKVAVSFMGQGVLKQLLTEGERYVMTGFSLLSLAEQGIYDVVSNLGSLAARFVFRPIEESAYLFFCQLWRRGVESDRQQPEQLAKVRLGLFRLLRLMVLLGLLVVCFGLSYSDLLLHIYGGENLTVGGGTNLLRAQCLLVFFLAINGVTECFARSVMTDVDITAYNRKMAVMSFIYLVLTWLLTTVIGVVGMVLANCCNMIVRIGFAIRVILSVFPYNATEQDPNRQSPIQGLFPDNDILLLLLSSGVCCRLSEIYLYPWSRGIHFLLGGLLFLLSVGGVLVKEEFMLSFLVEKYRAIRTRLKAD